MIGHTISHYRILDKLGEGGMGVVYRAQDEKLEREVALKFLAAHLLNDEEAKQRFLREAKAAAALTHPNVCHVYEIDEADGKTFISMAFVEGETLEDRISRGPLPIKDVLDIGQQIAKGLQAAHEKGIVHRDIKPANVLVARDGQVTIMDFGLARLTEASRLTKADTTMGTVAYMSPEQAQGGEVDHRCDVWALGCVLYEMVAGQRTFQGEYDQALLYEIVNQEPEPLTGIRAGVPMELEFISGKCLAKDADDRYQHASEIAVDLRTLAEKLKSGRSTILRTMNSAAGVPATMTEAARTPNSTQALPADAVIVSKRRLQTVYGFAAVLGIALLGLAYAYLGVPEPEAPPARVTRFSLAPEGLVRARISPDGRSIFYVAEVDGRRSLGLRSLSDESTSELPGTEGAMDGFWSPDSAWIGFGTRAELKKVSIEGGSPITLSELPHTGGIAFLGGTWSPDAERIVFSSGLQLYEVASSGGEPRLLFDALEGPRPNAFHPHFLPAGGGPAALVYVSGRSAQDNWVWVFNMETNERRELGPGSRPIYSQNGYLIQGPRNHTDLGLWALPFSLRTLESTEDPFPIGTAGSGASLARNGTLAYVEASVRRPLQTLVWHNRAGQKLETVGQPLGMLDPALSPDGQRVAVGSLGDANRDIWIHNLARSTKTRLTFEGQIEANPAWSPSGRDIAYRLSGSPGRIMRRSADGTGEAVTLVEADDPVYDPEWSRDGRYVLYHQSNSETLRDIRYIELGADGRAGEPITLLDSRGNEWQPRLSPDGRFLAYVSDESGRDEVYVCRFPSGEGKWHVSTNGGVRPRWRSDGKELYYVEGDMLTAVSVSTGSALTLGLPQALFVAPNLDPTRSPPQPGGYDVSADGQSFLMIAPVETDGEETAPSSIRVVMNWYEEFRDRQ